jgi:hypothetical protein
MCIFIGLSPTLPRREGEGGDAKVGRKIRVSKRERGKRRLAALKNNKIVGFCNWHITIVVLFHTDFFSHGS